jgi:solute carrier family 45 protein 1/2/4
MKADIAGHSPSLWRYALDQTQADNQFLKEMDDTANASNRQADRSAPPVYSTQPAHGSHERFRPIHARAASTPLGGGWRTSPNSPARPNERSHLIRSYSTADVEGSGESMEYTGSGPVAGGTIMGIHNLAIVFPQFIVSC